jgi:hypothetical protein
MTKQESRQVLHILFHSFLYTMYVYLKIIYNCDICSVINFVTVYLQV